MADATTAFGVGITGTGISILTLIGWVVARGIRSKCILGGNMMSIDIHRVTQEETAIIDNERNHTAIEIRPSPTPTQNPTQNPTPTPTPSIVYPSKSTETAAVIIEHVQVPPLHPVKTPKVRISKPLRNITPKSTNIYYEPTPVTADAREIDL